MKVLFEQWGYSLLNAEVSMWFQSADLTPIKKALTLYRDGLRFFRLKHNFYFDCFYLIEIFDKTLLDSLNEFLLVSGSNIFTKSALKQTFNAFISGDTRQLTIQKTLTRHRTENLEFEALPEIRVLVVATVSAGKSTLINALTGHDFNRVRNGVCTTRLCRIHNKLTADGITLKHGNEVAYDSDICAYSSEKANEVGVHFMSTLGSKRICLIDTPGVNNAQDSMHQQITSEAIKRGEYDIIVFISNGQYNGTYDERRLLNLLHSESKKPILFVLNQLDRFKQTEDDIARMLREYSRELMAIGFRSPQVFSVSAQYARLLRRESLLDEDERDELSLLRRKFMKPFFDMQAYLGDPSESEIEKSGIIALEKAIINHKQNNRPK